MKRLVLCVALLLASRTALAQDAASVLDAAEKAMGTAAITSVQYSGTGASYFVGQAPTPGGPWLHYTLKAYTADVDYATPAMRQVLDRVQDDGGAPFGGPHAVWLVSGKDAWNLAGNPAAPAPQYRDPSGLRTGAQRSAEVWLTPPGFLKAAKANKATVRKQGATFVVRFVTADRQLFTGVLNAQHLLEKTETVVDNPVVGDMPITMTFANYQAFGGMTFPTRMVETIGGFPALDLTVTDVKPGGAVAIGDTPVAARNQQATVVVKTEKLGDGVWYLTGGSHHSLLMEFRDYLVVLEGPQDADRAAGVIAEIHRLVPGKAIKYVVTTHNHFDHMGGLRTFAAEGATVVTSVAARAHFERVLNQPHTLNPDRLSTSGKKVRVEGVEGTRTLTDGTQRLDLPVIRLTHNVAMLFPYLPNLKLIVQADMQVAPAPNAPPGPPNPAAVELYDALVARKLDVAQIAGIHGRISSWKELQTLAGK